MATKRKAISKKTRFDVFKRDGFCCHYCGAKPPAVLLHVDHITPVAAGGDNSMDNLITSCDSCNLGKGARELSVVPQSLADKAKDIAEREAQLAGFMQVMQGKKDRIEDESWAIARIFDSDADAGFRKDRLTSIRTFLGKLNFYEVQEAAEIAVSRFHYGQNKCFQYFCGICWNKIKGD